MKCNFLMQLSFCSSAEPIVSRPPCLNRLLRLGVLGCGGFMRRFYSPMLQTLAARVHVVSLCDPQPDNLRIGGLLFPAARLHSNPESMLELEELDAILVLTSENANADMASLALKTNLPVYLEKPPARTLSEFRTLCAVEEQSTAPLFAAFNRRHTPLMRGFNPPLSLRSIRGRMERQERPIPSFPYTALHLLDSLLYFSKSTPAEFDIEFTHAKASQWTLEGCLKSGATFELEIVPDGIAHREYLIFEGEEESVEIQFPNPESNFPVGRFIRTSRKQDEELIQGHRDDTLHEMGYAPAFRGFLDLMENADPPPPPYQLSSCKDAIIIMENMKC